MLAVFVFVPVSQFSLAAASGGLLFAGLPELIFAGSSPVAGQTRGTRASVVAARELRVKAQ